MSFLQSIKDALQSRIGQIVIGQVPEVVTAVAEIEANPNQAIHVIAELVSHEIDVMRQTLAEHGETVAALSASAPGQASDSPAPVAAPVDVDAITRAVLDAINPKLDALAPALVLIAQHFPHLQTAAAE